MKTLTERVNEYKKGGNMKKILVVLVMLLVASTGYAQSIEEVTIKVDVDKICAVVPIQEIVGLDVELPLTNKEKVEVLIIHWLVTEERNGRAVNAGRTAKDAEQIDPTVAVIKK